jgi:hypothetical protein
MGGSFNLARIYNHDYNVFKHLGEKFFGHPLHNLYLGVELEVEVAGRHYKTYYGGHDQNGAYPSEWGDEVLNLLGEDFVVLKEDGSIDFGFEIVTAPASLPVHAERWKRLLESAYVSNFRAKRNCGMHVHMSRAGFLDPAHIIRMGNFITGNKRFITRMAGRSSTDYAYIDPRKKYQYADGIAWDNSRYEGLNVTPLHTVEMRIFASTLDYPRFLANLQFCKALATFTREVQDANLKTTDFRAWFGDKETSYPELSNLIYTKYPLAVINTSTPAVEVPEAQQELELVEVV